MKKLMLILFCASITALTAQTKRYEIGIAGGGGISKISNLNDNAEAAFSYIVSGSILTRIRPHFGIVFLPGIEKKGFKYQINLIDENGNLIGEDVVVNQLYYLTMPVVFQYAWGSDLRMFVNGGAYAGLQIGAREVIKELDMNSDVRDSYNPIDFGLTGGVGIAMAMADPWSFTAETRLNYGITNVFTNTNFENISVNWNICVLVGVTYSLGSAME